MHTLTKAGSTPASPASGKAGSTIRLTVGGLVLLCVSLVATSVVLTHLLDGRGRAADLPVPREAPAANTPAAEGAGAAAPWGELFKQDVDIQQPEEYVAFDSTPTQALWTFPGATASQVRQQLAECGFSENQVSSAMAQDRVSIADGATVLKPDAGLILSLTPQTRSKLYTILAAWPVNRFMHEPYHIQDSFALMAAQSGVSRKVVDLIHKLTYTRAGVDFFSDPGVAIAQTADAGERLRLLKALTFQTAVLARLRLNKNSDIDQIVAYWGAVPGVRAKDLRPLLESVVRTPDGGTLSLLYLLPQFARERLYTFPMPSQPGDKAMDCHWTALNFLNTEPDIRLGDPAYASAYIKERFYPIGKPTMCGDVMFLLDAAGGVIHSAVYIADDIYFTKNGVNYAQPWILMRLRNLLDAYTKTAAPQALYYRRKEC